MRRYLHRDDLTSAQSWAVVEWLAAHGASELTMAFMSSGPAPTLDRIESALHPHETCREDRQRISSYGKEGFHGPTVLWAVNTATLALLRECFPTGPLGDPTYEDGGWFEDLELYRDGDLVFGAVSHEGEAMVNLGNAEWAEFSAAGYTTRDRAQWI